MKPENIIELTKILVSRGLGIYGHETMQKICYDSGVALLDDDSIDWLQDDKEKAMNDFLINYSAMNLAAKMTAMVLAKRYGIPIPEQIKKKKKRKSRFQRILRK